MQETEIKLVLLDEKGIGSLPIESRLWGAISVGKYYDPWPTGTLRDAMDEIDKLKGLLNDKSKPIA